MDIRYYPTFKYVDVGIPASKKWERIPLTDLEKHRDKFGNTDFCRSVARYAAQEHQEGQPLLMGIMIDLDGEDLDASLNEARMLRDYFYQEWSLKKEEVRFYYSGNRSIYIDIQPETVNITPHENLYLYIKETMRIIADKLDLGCVDLNLYAKRHLYRCVGAIHSETGKFKIEIDPSELNLPAEEIRKLAATNRKPLYEEDDLELLKNEVAAQSFNELFEIAKKGIDEVNFRISSVEHLSLLRGIAKAPVCVQDILDNNIVVKGTRNRATLTLACFLKDIGKTKAETIDILTPWTKNIPHALTKTDEKKRLQQMEDVVNYVFSESGSEYHFACQFVLSLGTKQYPIKCKNRCQLRINKAATNKIKSKSTTEKRAKIAYLPEAGGFLIELVYNPITKTPAFAVYDAQKDCVTYEESISFDYPNIYYPFIDDNVIKGSVLLPSQAEEYGSDEDLYREVDAFIAKLFNEPNRTYRTFNTLYVFFSWVYDKLRSWCYIQHLGRAGGGKTRALEAIGYLCYRPILLGGADSAACMFRMLDHYRGTAIIDEATFSDKSEAHQAIVQILNVGYKIDGTVGRCEGDDNRQVRYCVGGPKILATREDFYDDGLRSRCFVRRMGRDNRIKTGPDKQPFILPDSFKQEALAIRNRLLFWRFRHWKDARLNIELEIKGVESRINEIVVPILGVMCNDAVKKDIEELAREQQEDLKQQRQSSLEGQILKAILEIGLDSADIAPAEIKEIINKDRKEKPVATTRVTKKLKQMELKVHQYGNRYLLTSCEKNRELLQQLYEDYSISSAEAVYNEKMHEDSKDVEGHTKAGSAPNEKWKL
jgi:hypothetical protein